MNLVGRPAGKRGKSLTERVREALAARITSEKLRPGDRLPSERELIAEFGVSRTVIRDALSRLRVEGLVEPRQGSGVFVCEPPYPLTSSRAGETLSSIVETLEIRAAIEIEAARLAATRGSPAQLTEIGERWEAMRHAGDAQASEAADLAFHLAIAAAANNPRFVEFFDFLGPRTIPRSQLRVLREMAPTPPDYATQLLNEHRIIRDAIFAHDFDAAGDAMRDHLRTSQARYISLIRSTSSLSQE